MSKNELRELARSSLHEPLYWVTEHDACFDYCYKCASKIAIGMSEILGQEVQVDGGSWASGEGESPKFCFRCHKPLDYSLSEEGMHLEIAHFAENGVPIPLTKSIAYELVAIETAMTDHKVEWGDYFYKITPTEFIIDDNALAHRKKLDDLS